MDARHCPTLVAIAAAGRALRVDAPCLACLPTTTAAASSARHSLSLFPHQPTGLPLNHQLVGLGGSLVRAVRTAPVYRMYSLGPKPALIRQPAGAGGSAFELEVWALPIEAVGCVPSLVPPAIEHARTSGAASAASSGAPPD